MVEGSVRRFSRLRRRMDVLDLYGVLFSGAAAGKRVDERIRGWRGTLGAGDESRIFGDWLVRAAVCRGFSEYHWTEHREMAAKRGRRGDLCASAYANRHRRLDLGDARFGDAFHAEKYDAGVESVYGEFLAADGFCVCRI